MVTINSRSAMLRTSALVCAMFAAPLLTAQTQNTDAATTAGAAPASTIEGHKAGDNATIVTKVLPRTPLEIGKSTDMIIELKDKAGKPISYDDLVEMHTEKIHLLIVDPSLGDYHHIHPKPTETAGEYAFKFTPRKAGEYKFFADLVPVKTNNQEYSVSSAEVAGEAEPVVKQQDRKVKVGDHTFELSFDNPKLVQGESNRATLKVTGPDGQPFDKLEPVMGAFAHMVAFSENREHIAHVHPQGKEPETADERGGPELTFYMNMSQPGYHMLYSQVQIGGKDVFAPFGLQVEPREIPNTVAGIYEEVDSNMNRLDNVISSGKLAQVHGLAFWVRDVLLGLPKAQDVPQDSKDQLEQSLKRIQSYADLLDRYGDTDQQDQTAAVYKRFSEEVEKIRGLVKAPAAKETAAAEKLGNMNCPVSKMPVGSMEPGASMVYNGLEIGLCCSGCKETFMTDPEAFLQKARESVKK